ncbi:MAG: energy-coupling factor ABC transporter permease [Verrucomicrobia bacterium]|nr:energy-coupling factor ABC transporter permease [Verrucomicrobiota bacterium]
MHIPTSMMDGAVCPVTAAVSVGGIALAAVMAWKAKERPAPARFAAVSAVIFAGQMVNFPVQFGTSGHLLGGVLAAALLGVPCGVLAVALVVTLQCLVFADGGMAVLGANLLNMAILGTGVGGSIWQRLASAAPQHRPVTLGLAAWLSVLLAALGCSLELAAAGTIPFSQVLPAMLGVHALIGVGEAVVTVAVMALLTSAALSATARRPVFFLGIAAFVIALVGAPFACQWPDGLESVAKTLGFLHASAPSFVAPLPDYAFPAISHAMLSTSLAGLLGAVVTFLAAWGIATTWRRNPAAT